MGTLGEPGMGTPPTPPMPQFWAPTRQTPRHSTAKGTNCGSVCSLGEAVAPGFPEAAHGPVREAFSPSCQAPAVPPEWTSGPVPVPVSTEFPKARPGGSSV